MATTILLLAISFLLLILLFTPVYRKEIKICQKPYIFYVENSAPLKLKAVIWGYNKYLSSPNFGSNIGVTVRSDINVSYLQSITQSFHEPFSIWKTVIFGKLGELQNLSINIVSSDANGSNSSVPLSIGSYVSPENKFKNVDDYISVEVPFSIPIDGRKHIEFDVNQNSKIDFSFSFKTETFVKSNFFSILYNRLDKKVIAR